VSFLFAAVLVSVGIGPPTVVYDPVRRVSVTFPAGWEVTYDFDNMPFAGEWWGEPLVWAKKGEEATVVIESTPEPGVTTEEHAQRERKGHSDRWPENTTKRGRLKTGSGVAATKAISRGDRQDFEALLIKDDRLWQIDLHADTKAYTAVSRDLQKLATSLQIGIDQPRQGHVVVVKNSLFRNPR